MAFTNLQGPPPDNSGGYLQIKYSNGPYTHRMRVHVQGFQTALSSGGDNTTVPNGDYPYNTPPGTGGEVGVNDTFTALVNLLKPTYTTDWTFSLEKLVQNFNGALSPTFPTPTPTPLAGTSTGEVSGEIYDPAGMYLANMNTNLGGRFRLCLIGGVNWQGGPASTVSPTAGNTFWQPIVGYLTGATTRIQGHDGGKVIGTAHLTQAYNRRLRRRYAQS